MQDVQTTPRRGTQRKAPLPIAALLPEKKAKTETRYVPYGPKPRPFPKPALKVPLAVSKPGTKRKADKAPKGPRDKYVKIAGDTDPPPPPANETSLERRNRLHKEIRDIINPPPPPKHAKTWWEDFKDLPMELEHGAEETTSYVKEHAQKVAQLVTDFKAAKAAAQEARAALAGISIFS